MIVTHKLQEVIAYIAARERDAPRHNRRANAHERDERSMTSRAQWSAATSRSVAAHVDCAASPCVSVRICAPATAHARYTGMSFEVRAGEIVGIAGVEGNGQTTLADALSGSDPYEGSIGVDGTSGVIPQDRHREALVLRWSIVENAVLGRQNVAGVPARHRARSERRAPTRKDQLERSTCAPRRPTSPARYRAETSRRSSSAARCWAIAGVSFSHTSRRAASTSALSRSCSRG